jgi:hypothetical protein
LRAQGITCSCRVYVVVVVVGVDEVVEVGAVVGPEPKWQRTVEVVVVVNPMLSGGRSGSARKVVVASVVIRRPNAIRRKVRISTRSVVMVLRLL